MRFGWIGHGNRSDSEVLVGTPGWWEVEKAEGTLLMGVGCGRRVIQLAYWANIQQIPLGQVRWRLKCGARAPGV